MEFLKGFIRSFRHVSTNVFKVGGIYRMHPANRSHVRTPYYVEVIEIGNDFIITNIPGKHSLRIVKGSNWDYHIPRMEFIGTQETHGHLLLNQENLLPE